MVFHPRMSSPLFLYHLIHYIHKIKTGLQSYLQLIFVFPLSDAKQGGVYNYIIIVDMIANQFLFYEYYGEAANQY